VAQFFTKLLCDIPRLRVLITDLVAEHFSVEQRELISQEIDESHGKPLLRSSVARIQGRCATNTAQLLRRWAHIAQESGVGVWLTEPAQESR